MYNYKRRYNLNSPHRFEYALLNYRCKDDKFLAVMLTTMGLKSRIPMRLRHRNGRTSSAPRPSAVSNQKHFKMIFRVHLSYMNLMIH